VMPVTGQKAAAWGLSRSQRLKKDQNVVKRRSKESHKRLVPVLRYISAQVTQRL
jgi:hypothetical protein